MSVAPDNAPDRDFDLASADLEQERTWLSAARDDPEKFRFFYDKYARRIYSFVFRRTLDTELTEDLVALTFTKALSSLDRFVWKGISVGSWLFQIAANEIRKHAARTTRMARVDEATLRETTPDPKRSQLTRMILSEDQMQLYECLNCLSQQDQDIFILHYWEGLKTREVAEALNIMENTVKTRLRRGRERLKELMSMHGGRSLAPTPPERDWGRDPDLRFARWAPPDSDRT